MAALSPGTVLDRYVVECRIGEGGMADVYRVRHQALGSRHALKVLTLTSEDVRERLVLEGKVQAALQHPNVVTVSDVLDVNGNPGLVMEFVQGPALDHWLYNYAPSLDEALRVFRGIVAGVGAAHQRGMVHRDLKPANIMLRVDERGVHPKVTDFGLAKVTHADDRRKTRSGTTMGTPQYMAPEQIRDASTVDRRADIYSLGVILYELVCGQPPYPDEDVIELFTKVAAGDHRHPRDHNAGLPDEVVRCIEAAMAIDPARRARDCSQLLTLLAGGTIDLEAPAPVPLPAPAPMPPDSGPTSLNPDSPGAAIAARFVRDIQTIEPDPPSASSLLEVEAPADGPRLVVDMRTPTPPPEPQARPARKLWLGVLAAAVVLLGVTGGVAVAGLTLASLLGSDSTAASAPAPPSPAPGAADVAPAPEPPPPAPLPATRSASPAPSAATDPAPTATPPSAPAPVQPAPTPPPLPAPPTPAIEPDPTPTTPAPEAAPTATLPGRFRYEPQPGIKLVQLEGPDGTRYLEGEALEPGSYKVLLRVEGMPAKPAGEVEIASDRTVTLRCVTAMLQCKPI